jgi:hypothetical protein
VKITPQQFDQAILDAMRSALVHGHARRVDVSRHFDGRLERISPIVTVEDLSIPLFRSHLIVALKIMPPEDSDPLVGWATEPLQIEHVNGGGEG